MTALPKTTSGKIKRRELRELERARAGEEGQEPRIGRTRNAHLGRVAWLALRGAARCQPRARPVPTG